MKKNRMALVILPILMTLVLASCGTNSQDSSGSQRFGSGQMMNNVLNSLSAEDKAVFQQFLDARRSGNTTLANQLRDELQKKYPNLRLGGGRGRNGSGSFNTGSVNVPPIPPVN